VISDDFGLNAGSGMFLHELPQTRLAAFVQRWGELPVSLMGGVIGERVFPKPDQVEGHKPGPMMLSERVFICRRGEVREIDRIQDGSQLHNGYSATCSPPPPGSFFLKRKLRQNMIAEATARTMNVSMYASVAA